MKIKPIIGIEVHLELKTVSKMFCGCLADHFGKKPNTLCCPVCLGLPGSLPVPNKKAVEWTILLGLALNCQVSKESYFERKNYFYPDLPKGYQISQYHAPFCINGWLNIESSSLNTKYQILNTKKIRIQRVHLEEDTGKLLHKEIDGKKVTLIDFNRAGVPLVEIVSEPDLHSSEEAKIYLQKLQQIIRWLGISNAEMEKGTMRCEPNVNVKILDQGRWVETPIVEIKNINSFKFVQKAIDYEVKRQIEEYKQTKITKEAGNKITRGFDENKGVTYPQRQKEEAFDYRYFPEPDIPPIRWTDSQLLGLHSQLSKIELPDKKRKRFVKQYGLSEYQAGILTATKKTAEYFEKIVAKRQDLVEMAANWIINKRVNVKKIKPEKLVKLIVEELEKETLPVKEIVKVIKEVIKEYQKAVADYKGGKKEAIEFLLGQVMKKTRGAADPKEARMMIKLVIGKQI